MTYKHIASKGFFSSISFRVSFISVCAFAIVSLGIILVVFSFARKEALREAEEKAMIVLNRNLAFHQYFNTQMKPRLFSLTKSFLPPDYFDPFWMSSTHAVRSINKIDTVLSGNDGYYYKECAINARSPLNEADDFENMFLVKLNKDQNFNVQSGVRTIEGKPYFYVLRRGESMEDACMRCHSTPEKAPGDMVDQYGPERSFDRKAGSVISALSIRIPLEQAYAEANKLSVMLSIMVVSSFASILLFLYLLMQRYIFIPLLFIKQKAEDIIEDKQNLGIDIPGHYGNELNDLTSKFNTMSHRLKDQMDKLEDRVKERTFELETSLNENNKMLLRQQGISLIHQSLLAPAPLEDKLKRVTDSIVRLFEADFCRIWLIRPGDLCERDCVHAGVQEGPNVCRYRDRCLHLLASSGRYTHIDGEVHRRVPFGVYKIGCIASNEDHKFLTNDVTNDPGVHNHEWARELGLVSFAGYQLRIPGEEALGVLALFNKQPILPAEDALLDALSSALAQAIRQAQGEEALRTSEFFLNKLLETIPIPVFYKDKEGRYLGFNKAFENFFGKSKEELIGKSVFDINPTELAKVYHAQDTKLFETPGVQIYDSQVRNVHGALRDVIFHKASLTDIQGSITGLVGAILDVTARKHDEEELKRYSAELEKKNKELQDALANVKQLAGMLPICASCKQIRDDKGYWKSVELYISEHSEAVFSHGICPDCEKKMYEDLDKLIPENP